jgi:hypothetical protein
MKYLSLTLLLWKLKRADCQPLEDKMARKPVTWDGKNIKAVGHGALVKSVLTSQEIFNLTALNILSGCLHSMNKFECSFLWSDTKEVTGGKCELNWEAVCGPTRLWLRWPWFEWREPKKLWVGMGTPLSPRLTWIFSYHHYNHHLKRKSCAFLELTWNQWKETQRYCSSHLRSLREKGMECESSFPQQCLDFKDLDRCSIDYCSRT